MKLRIAIVCDAINNFVGGSFLSALRFSELLAQRGHHVIIISSKYPSTPRIDQHKGIRIYRMPSFPVLYSGERLYLAYLCEKRIEDVLRKERVQLLHFMLPTPLSVSAIHAAEELGVRIVGHSHTQPDNWLAPVPLGLATVRKNMIRLSYRYLTRIYGHAHAVVCPSEFSQHLLKAHRLKVPTYAISNGVDTKRFRMQARTTKQQTMLFVGRLDKDKNVMLLIEAAAHIKKRLPDFKMLLVGNGAERKKLESRAQKLGVTDNIVFLGRVDDATLVKLYHQADLFVLPSLIELEGMVVLEAMACAKPLLISNSQTSASRFFVKGNGLLFNPHNARDLAKKAVLLLTDDALRKRMAKESLRQSKAYDIERSIDRLEKVYERVLSDHVPRQSAPEQVAGDSKNRKHRKQVLARLEVPVQRRVRDA
jgi:glycosyltransferase involved in cell wall biosynthesis